MVSVLGFGSNPQTPPSTGSTTGQKPTFGKYKFYQHAKETKIKGGKVGFFNKVSNVKWDKMMSQSGRKEFLVERGKEKVTAREMKRQVANIIEQYGGNGITGKALKVKLVRKYGMKYKDADIVARAATYQYHVPEPEGPTAAEVRANILGGIATSEQKEETYATTLKKRREDSIGDSENTGHEHLGIRNEDQERSSTSALSGQETGQISADGNRGKDATAGIDQVSEDEITPVAGEHEGQEKKTTKQSKQKSGFQPVQMNFGAGGVPDSILPGQTRGEKSPVIKKARPGYSEIHDLERIKKDAESQGEMESGKVDNPVSELMQQKAHEGYEHVTPYKIARITNKDKLQKKLEDNGSEEDEDAEQEENDSAPVTDNLPEEGAADDYNEEDLKKAA